MTRVLVTGAGGYIGSVLVPLLLDRGHEVVACDRFFFGRDTLPAACEALTTRQQDIRWMEGEELQDVDAVVDLAAISNDPAGELDTEKTWQINHRGRVRIAELARAVGVKRYVLPSSCSIYGFQDDILDEGSPVNPLTTYAKANLEAEDDVLKLSDNSFVVVVLRQATVYGLSRRMRFDLAVNGMVKGFFAHGKVPVLRDGTQWRPFVHVLDTSRAIAEVLEAEPSLVNGQRFNVGSDEQNVQIMELARAVADAIGTPFKYEWYGDPDHRSYRVSFRKIRDVLGFAPVRTIGDGAKEVFDALKTGTVDAKDPRTITVYWYKHLNEIHELLKSVEMRGQLL